MTGPVRSGLPTFEFTPHWGYPVGTWYRCFAWLPVRTVDGRRRWLWPVERRLIQLKDSAPGPFHEWFQYRVAS